MRVARSIPRRSGKATRGWKLLLLLPRMILFRPGRGGSVPRSKLEARITSFQRGGWLELLAEGASCAERVHTQSIRRRRRQQHDDDGKRAARALSLVQMGELFAARQALEGAPVAPGNMATLRALTDLEKRPPLPREELSRAVAEAQPMEQFELDIVICLRRARRGAAPGPSGMTSDHLYPVLGSEAASELLTQVASLFAVGQVPQDIWRPLGWVVSQHFRNQTEVCEGLSSVTSSVGSWLGPWRNKSPRELKLPQLPSSTP